MLPLIEEHHEDTTKLCEKYGMRKLKLFGSGCRGEFDLETSDLDFVAEFANIRIPGYLDRYLGLADSLEALLHRQVDLVTPGAIKSQWFREAVNECRITVYEAKRREAAA